MSPGQDEGQPCAVQDCDSPAVPCFDSHLCMAHGTAANRVRDKAGLTYAEWFEVVAYVAGWIAAQNPMRKAGT